MISAAALNLTSGPPTRTGGGNAKKNKTHLREPRLALFGRLVEAAPTSGRRGPAAELLALVHGRRSQAPGRPALAAVRALQRVHVQVRVVARAPAAATSAAAAAAADRMSGWLEHGVVQVLGGQVALRVERL